MRVSRRGLICFLVFILGSVNVRAENDRIQLKITDCNSQAIHGVYIVHAQSHILLETTNDEGECVFDIKKIPVEDTIVFSCLGFHDKKLSVAALIDRKQIVLEGKSILLEEVVSQGISSENLLRKVSENLLKERGKVDKFRYFGNGQYEKITECRENVVEYRREYGCFLTIGNAKERKNFDYGGGYAFIPRYAARSFPLDSGGNDTLYPLYIRNTPLYYASGCRKIFKLMRTVELYGPLFGGTKYYDIQRVETEKKDYTFQFKTKTSCYPAKTDLYCRGALVIDHETHRLKSISLAYIEYYLCHDTERVKKILKNISVVSKADIEFDYTHNGEYFPKSVVLTSFWKGVSVGRNWYGDYPSRRNPGKNNLVEKEAFYCKSYRGIPVEIQSKKLGLGLAEIAAYNPQGEYCPEIFKQLPELLDSRQAFRELSVYKNIYEQFDQMSDRPYYPDDYLLSSPWITEEKMFDSYFCQKFGVVRKLLLKLFYKEE